MGEKMSYEQKMWCIDILQKHQHYEREMHKVWCLINPNASAEEKLQRHRAVKDHQKCQKEEFVKKIEARYVKDNNPKRSSGVVASSKERAGVTDHFYGFV